MSLDKCINAFLNKYVTLYPLGSKYDSYSSKKKCDYKRIRKFRQSFVTEDKECYSKLYDLSQLALIQATSIVGEDFITTIKDFFF